MNSPNPSENQKTSSKFKSEQLLDFMAKACHYSQSHCGDPSAWPDNERSTLFQCTSFQMSCFLAQNTILGGNGVEWEVVMDELCNTEKNDQGFMLKSIPQWKSILLSKVEELGGWK